MEIIYRFFSVDSDSDIIQWLDLHKICFQRTVSREFWHWIHMGNPFYTKTKPMIVIAETENRIVGSVSLIPIHLQITANHEHRVLTSCLVCKAMVHPDYQNRGIFSSLLKKGIKLTREEGYDLLITFSNNPYSYQGFVQQGFQYVTDVIQSKYYISPDRLSKKYTAVLPGQIRKHINRSLSRIYSLLLPEIHHTFRICYNEISEVTEEIYRIHFPDNTGSGIFGGRTPEFIRWRLSSDGIHFKCLSLWDKDKMLAYLIIGIQDRRKSALIADLFSRENDKSLILILVNEAVTILKKENFNSFWTYLLDRNWDLSTIFSLRYGFIRRPSGAGNNAKLRFLCFPLSDPVCDADFSDKNLWNIHSLDSCMFWPR